ncbi:peptide deformylase [Janthinobacterium sp.]|uniref:peptide deformylase n=1 Tax=Janthinobacterium sp. TaxID=1871054 RepID=UPI0025C3B3D9|nr:peptide deformylase [Janthinobacterium sp.]NBV19677.1 peptide deformylase [Janthinobacterium sp.]
MAKVKIVRYPNPILREKIDHLDEINQDVLDAIWSISTKLPFCNGYALAANQIGIGMPIFGYLENRRHKFLINPVIKESSDDMFFYQEGCLSIPNFYFPIERPNTILVEALNPDGNTVEIEASGLLGRIFQHEIDHLNGKLVIDLLNEEQKQYFEEKRMSLAQSRKVTGKSKPPKPKND